MTNKNYIMKKIVFLSLTLLFSLSLFAQNVDNGGKYGPYVTNKFFDNWFISFGAGTQVLFGEHDNNASFKDRLSPAVDFSIGKWVTPSIGFRAQYSGYEAVGVVRDPLAKFITGPSSKLAGFYDEKFNFFNLHADVLWNLSSTIGGYRMDRTIEFIPFLGVGYAKSWKKNVNPEFKEAAAVTGLINKVRLSDALNLNLEIRALLVNRRFDGYNVGNGIEEIVSATVGFTYNFAKRGFNRYQPPIVPDYSPYNNRIDELERRIRDAEDKSSKLSRELTAAKESEPKVVNVVEYVVSPIAIFFPIGQSRLTDKDLINIGNFAEIVKKSGKKYKIMGSADSATGSRRINQKLSEDRANAVYNALVNKFGVNPQQLEVIAKGDKNEPFDKPILNRVVILE